MTNTLIIMALALAGAAGAHAHSAAAPQDRPAQPAEATAATSGLSDLESLTFGCPKAALNAAARRASQAPSQGTYQFSYFNIVSNTHHAAFEVHFKSNYADEPELKYCVEMYCQQGWDPNTAKIAVTLMSSAPRHATGAVHADSCVAVRPPAKQTKKGSSRR
jgi:hypothetical protein